MWVCHGYPYFTRTSFAVVYRVETKYFKWSESKMMNSGCGDQGGYHKLNTVWSMMSWAGHLGTCQYSGSCGRAPQIQGTSIPYNWFKAGLRYILSSRSAWGHVVRLSLKHFRGKKWLLKEVMEARTFGSMNCVWEDCESINASGADLWVWLTKARVEI